MKIMFVHYVFNINRWLDMKKELNCLQRPKNRYLLDEWENVRQLVIKGAKKSNVDLSKIFLVEEVKKY